MQLNPVTVIDFFIQILIPSWLSIKLIVKMPNFNWYCQVQNTCLEINEKHATRSGIGWHFISGSTLAMTWHSSASLPTICQPFTHNFKERSLRVLFVNVGIDKSTICWPSTSVWSVGLPTTTNHCQHRQPLTALAQCRVAMWGFVRHWRSGKLNYGFSEDVWNIWDIGWFFLPCFDRVQACASRSQCQ